MTKLAVKETIHNARPLVCVQCMTFNHEKYIEDALNGFVMQKTDFPFVVAVVDDASTDNNASVIVNYVAMHCNCKSNYVDEEKDYGRVIQAHPLTNPNCLFHIVLLKENHYRKKPKRPYYAEYEDAAKYIARCEGDDYWMDPYKLQKQVGILEQNDKLSICINQVQAVSRSKEKTDWLIPYDNVIEQGEFTLEDFCRLEFGGLEWIFHLNGFLYRRENELGRLNDPVMKMFPYGDMPLLLYCLLHGNGYYIHELMSCYRVDSGGYNSTMEANPMRNIQEEHKLADALRAFDKYTQKNYHKYIMQRIRMCEYREYTLSGQSLWKILLPMYWKCIPGQTTRKKMLNAIEIVSPKTRKILKKLKYRC